MNLKTLLDTPPWEWPPATAKNLHEILTGHRANESDLLMAAQLAGDSTVINDQLSDALLKIVASHDQSPRLRARAAISFGAALEQTDIDGFEDPDDVLISERTFNHIQSLFHKLYQDESTPKELRRKILEASVRAPQDWHRDAILAAYLSRDQEWMLTAMFSMRWVRGFDEQILEGLDSAHPDIHYNAVKAAGNWGLDAAWAHTAALVKDSATPTPLLLAAIDAVASIRPPMASKILSKLANSEDEEIAEAAEEAISLAEVMADEGDDEEATEDWIN